MPSIQPSVSTAAAVVEADIRGVAAAHNPTYSTAAAAASNSSNSGSSGSDGAAIEAAVALAAAVAAAAAGASTAGRKRTLQQRLQDEALPELQADVQQPTAPKKRATTATSAAISAAAAAATAAGGKSRAASSAKHSTTAAAAAAAIAATAVKPVSVWAGTHCYSAEPLFCVTEAAADEVSAQRFSTAFVTVWSFALCACC
jgi:trimeric autotransporter adhesin